MGTVGRVAVIVVAQCALLGALGTGTGAVGLAEPRTIASYNFVDWVAQDGALIAWSADAGGCSVLVVLNRATGKRWTLQNPMRGGDTCSSVNSIVAIAGRRVLWSGFQNCCNNGDGDILTVTVGSSRRNVLESLSLDGWIQGDFMSAAAGDGTTLVYAIADSDTGPGCFTGNEPDCDRVVPEGGEVWRVADGKRAEVRGAPAAAMLAVAGRNVLIVPAAKACAEPPDPPGYEVGCWPVARPNAPMTIRDAFTGRRVAALRSRGRVLAVSMSGTSAAALVQREGRRWIDFFTLRTQRLLRTTAVPSTARELALAGTSIAFTTQRDVRLLRGTTIRVLARARRTPFALSAEGGRLVWAEGGDIRELRVGG